MGATTLLHSLHGALVVCCVVRAASLLLVVVCVSSCGNCIQQLVFSQLFGGRYYCSSCNFHSFWDISTSSSSSS